MSGYNIQSKIQVICKQLTKALHSKRKFLSTSTYQSLVSKLDKLTTPYENDKGKNVYPKNKKSLIYFSNELKQNTPKEKTIKAVKKK